MKLRVRITCVLAFAALAVSSCNSDSDSDETFNLAFMPPDGSGLGATDVDTELATVVNQNVNLPVGYTISGVVTDGGGAPLQNVDVSFRMAADTDELDEDTTDGTGAYSIAVPAGTWVAVLDSADDTLGTMTVINISVDADATIDFQFPATVNVPGTVYESDGITPIVGADVEFTGTTTEATDTVTTDGSGDYSVSLVPDTYYVVVTPNGLTTHLKQRFTVVVTGATIQNFTLSEGVQVSGTVLTNFSQPLLEESDVRVTLPEGSDFFSPGEVASDETDGSYTIDLVPPGTVYFEVEAPGDSGFPRQRLTRQITGPTTQTVNLTLAAGYILSGTILQDDGITPEQNVEVRAVPDMGAMLPPNYTEGEDEDDTDVAGQFEISVFPGTYDIEIVPEATNLQLPELRTFSITSNMVLNVTLIRGVELTGTVSVPGGGAPAPDIRVEIPGVFHAYDVTDGGGVYSFLAPEGTHALDLTAEDGQSEYVALDSITDVVVAAPGPVTEDITLSVSTTGTRIVQGTVFATDGVTPVAGVQIRATDLQGNILGVGTTDAGGDYLIVLIDVASTGSFMSSM